MAKTLVFLHTAPSNVTTFAHLLAQLDPSVPAKHVLDESLLQEARETGITPSLEQRIHQRLADETDDNTAVVLCTCSTIGDSAERGVAANGTGVIRVDRPMAEAAVAMGSRIIVAAALESTIGPTSELIQAVADEQGRTVTIHPLLCAGAWERFEAGDQAGYWQSVADTLHQIGQGDALEGDVIVLAQASMAGAAPLLADHPLPILSSPALGLEAALRAYHAAA